MTGVLKEDFLGPFEQWKWLDVIMKCTFTLAVIITAAL
jgi:hypothetical protein